MSMLRMDATFWSTPAEVTRTSVAPCMFSTASARAVTPASSATSTAMCVASPPVSAISPATAFAPSSSISATTTKSPSSANRFAVARPIPLPPPVTTTIRFPVMPRSSLVSLFRARPGCRAAVRPPMDSRLRGNDIDCVRTVLWRRIGAGTPGRARPAAARCARSPRESDSCVVGKSCSSSTRLPRTMFSSMAARAVPVYAPLLCIQGYFTLAARR